MRLHHGSGRLGSAHGISRLGQEVCKLSAVPLFLQILRNGRLEGPGLFAVLASFRASQCSRHRGYDWE
jgi:hypothetical protein